MDETTAFAAARRLDTREDWQDYGAPFQDVDTVNALVDDFNRRSIMWEYRVAPHGLRYIMQRRMRS